MFKNLPPLTRGLLLAFIACFVVLLFGRDEALQILSLYGRAVTEGFQLWRIVTYAFCAPAFFGLITTGFIVFYFGSELESLLGTKTVARALAISVAGGALLLALLFPDAVAVGPKTITLSLITGVVYMWPDREVMLFGAIRVKVWIIGLVYFLLTILPMSGTRLNLSGADLFLPLFAIIATTAYFHIMYQRYAFGRGLLNSMKRSRPREQKHKGNIFSDPRTVQARIDSLLDKISQSGMKSLTDDEKEFLRRYS